MACEVPLFDHLVLTPRYCPKSRSRAGISPRTGRIIGASAWGELPISGANFTTIVYRLHFELFAGAPGAIIVGFSGIACILLVGIGLYLWWRRPGRWRQRLTLKRGAPPVRRHYDLHNLTGASASVVLVVVALSGTYMTFPDQMGGGLATVFAVTPDAAPQRSAPYKAGSASMAERLVRERFADSRYDSISLPSGEGPIRLAVREDGDPRQHYGSTRIDADPATGAIVHVRRPTDDTVADLVMRWQFPLHSGEALALPGRLLVFLSGLAPAILVWTGIRLWLARRRARLIVGTKPRQSAMTTDVHGRSLQGIGVMTERL